MLRHLHRVPGHFFPNVSASGNSSSALTNLRTVKQTTFEAAVGIATHCIHGAGRDPDHCNGRAPSMIGTLWGMVIHRPLMLLARNTALTKV
jgi:hypothetical protein